MLKTPREDYEMIIEIQPGWDSRILIDKVYGTFDAQSHFDF